MLRPFSPNCSLSALRKFTPSPDTVRATGIEVPPKLARTALLQPPTHNTPAQNQRPPARPPTDHCLPPVLGFRLPEVPVQLVCAVLYVQFVGLLLFVPFLA